MVNKFTPREFNYDIPATVTLTPASVRAGLRRVQAQLLSHDINGGKKKLNMDTTCEMNGCGTAACIGGWLSIFMLGFEDVRGERESITDELFSELSRLDPKLWSLFHDFHATHDYNEPNVAATAIERYLRGQKPWQKGAMPNVLPYAKPVRKRAAKHK